MLDRRTATPALGTAAALLAGGLTVASAGPVPTPAPTSTPAARSAPAQLIYKVETAEPVVVPDHRRRRGPRAEHDRGGGAGRRNRPGVGLLQGGHEPRPGLGSEISDGVVAFALLTDYLK
jgi:hypothetical protein